MDCSRLEQVDGSDPLVALVVILRAECELPELMRDVLLLPDSSANEEVAGGLRPPRRDHIINVLQNDCPERVRDALALLLAMIVLELCLCEDDVSLLNVLGRLDSFLCEDSSLYHLSP